MRVVVYVFKKVMGVFCGLLMIMIVCVPVLGWFYGFVSLFVLVLFWVLWGCCFFVGGLLFISVWVAVCLLLVCCLFVCAVCPVWLISLCVFALFFVVDVVSCLWVVGFSYGGRLFVG